MEKYLILEIKPINKSRYKVVCDGCFPFVLYKGELSHYNLAEGGELEEAALCEIKEKVLKKRAKKRAMALLEKRDYTEEKLRAKMREGMYPEDIVEDTLEYLKGYGYINDKRFAERFLEFHGDAMTKYGLKLKLYQKGISSDVIDEVLDDFELTDERELIRKIFEKKNFDTESSTEKEKNRMIRYLVSKGFSMNNIKKML